MDLPHLIEALSRPEAYSHPADDLQVRHTHISVVFLAGSLAYKKPVQLGFVDFSTLQKRRFFCNQEVHLNRRLAPHVYLGVVPVTAWDGFEIRPTHRGDQVRFGGDGPVVEWAVQMQRLPEEATLARRLGRGQVSRDHARALARRLASFHASLTPGTDTHGFGDFPAVARNARENFGEAAPQVGTALSRAVCLRLVALTEQELARLRPLIEKRARRGVPRDTHGDLHLDHVYLFPDEQPPADLVVVDCIEFNDRFRYADPVADMAFLVMDLVFHGRRDLASAFCDVDFEAAADDEGRELLPFCMAYRAAVRGKVEGMELAEAEIPQAERSAALVLAQAHWLLVLGLLEPPEKKPCLVLGAGLPGAGKSTLARGLADRAGFELIRSDLVRKELAKGLHGEAIYTPEWIHRTYAECLRRAQALLFEGRRVLVDANFRREQQRHLFLQAAARWAIPFQILVCRTDRETIRQRLVARRGDVSDADLAIFDKLTREWEEPGPAILPFWREMNTNDREDALRQALACVQVLP
jgi:aminoglycoside phosphotransferase family enzyme/predicted kinase